MGAAISNLFSFITHLRAINAWPVFLYLYSNH